MSPTCKGKMFVGREKGKAARGGWGGAVPFSIKASISPGTYALNIRTVYDEFANSYPGGSSSVTLRTLDEHGISRRDNRIISDSEPFYATGKAFVSSDGRIVLVEVIPADGFPGWIELKSVMSRKEAGTSGDVANDAVEAWFIADFGSKRPKKAKRV